MNPPQQGPFSAQPIKKSNQEKPPGATNRRQKNRQRNNHSGRNPQKQRGELGFFGSLHDLQRNQPSENTTKTRAHKRSRRYYGRQHQNGAPRFFHPQPKQHYFTPTPPLFFPSSPPGWPHSYQGGPPALTPVRFPGAEGGIVLSTPVVNIHNKQGAAEATADKLEAEGMHSGLDPFATNEGIVFYTSEDDHEEEDEPSPATHEEGGSHSFSEDDDDDEDDDEHDGYEDDDEADGLGGTEDFGREKKKRKQHFPHHAASALGGGGRGGGEEGSAFQHRVIRRLRERVAYQDAYIAELEDENLRYEERLGLAVQRIKRLEGEGRVRQQRVGNVSGDEEVKGAMVPRPSSTTVNVGGGVAVGGGGGGGGGGG